MSSMHLMEQSTVKIWHQTKPKEEDVYRHRRLRGRSPCQKAHSLLHISLSYALLQTCNESQEKKKGGKEKKRQGRVTVMPPVPLISAEPTPEHLHASFVKAMKQYHVSHGLQPWSGFSDRSSATD